jgi:hypothetical protein
MTGDAYQREPGEEPQPTHVTFGLDMSHAGLDSPDVELTPGVARAIVVDADMRLRYALERLAAVDRAKPVTGMTLLEVAHDAGLVSTAAAILLNVRSQL